MITTKMACDDVVWIAVQPDDAWPLACIEGKATYRDILRCVELAIQYGSAACLRWCAAQDLPARCDARELIDIQRGEILDARHRDWFPNRCLGESGLITAAHAAAASGSLQTLKQILEAEPSAVSGCGKHEMTPLSIAFRWNNRPAIEFLLPRTPSDRVAASLSACQSGLRVREPDIMAAALTRISVGQTLYTSDSFHSWSTCIRRGSEQVIRALPREVVRGVLQGSTGASILKSIIKRGMAQCLRDLSCRGRPISAALDGPLDFHRDWGPITIDDAKIAALCGNAALARYWLFNGRVVTPCGVSSVCERAHFPRPLSDDMIELIRACVEKGGTRIDDEHLLWQFTMVRTWGEACRDGAALGRIGRSIAWEDVQKVKGYAKRLAFAACFRNDPDGARVVIDWASGDAEGKKVIDDMAMECFSYHAEKVFRVLVERGCVEVVPTAGG